MQQCPAGILAAFYFPAEFDLVPVGDDALGQRGDLVEEVLQAAEAVVVDVLAEEAHEVVALGLLLAVAVERLLKVGQVGGRLRGDLLARLGGGALGAEALQHLVERVLAEGTLGAEQALLVGRERSKWLPDGRRRLF